MNDVDAELRALLTERAADIPAAVGLFEAVHRRERRARQRRLALASVVVVLLLLAGATVAWATQRDDRLVPTNPPARGLKAPPSPVSVTWVPAGFTTPQVSLVSRETWSIKSIRRDPLAQLTVRVAPAALKIRTGLGTRRTITINGVKATYYTVPLDLKGAKPYGQTPPPAQRPMAQLTFQRKPGQWVQLDVHNVTGKPNLGVTEQDVRKIAEGLVDRPMPVPDLLRFKSIPAGVAFGSVWDNYGNGAEVQFVDPAEPPEATDVNGGHSTSYRIPFLVQAVSTKDPTLNSSTLGNGAAKVRTIRVDGRDVTLYSPDVWRRQTVVLPFGTGQVLLVSAASSLGLKDQQLARFAFGVQRGKDYRCCVYVK